MRQIFAWLALLLAVLAAPAAAQRDLDAQSRQFLESLSPRDGTVPIPEASATLELGKDYLFYGPDDARRILVEAWGNPPEAADGVLGLVMPAGTTPLSDAWGAVVTYEDTGYVSDDDAAETDYDAILAELKAATLAANEARTAQGYPAMEVVGWAEKPNYDAKSHSVVWARDLKVFGDQFNSLNYDVRTLGRRGVLSLNLISAMPELSNVRLAARDFASHVRFDAGARYEDFDPSIDRQAEYGVGGLVAAGVGVAAAKKLGLFALLAKFLKPILIGLAVLVAALWGRIRRLLGRGDDDDGDWQNYEEHAGLAGETDASPAAEEAGGR